MIDAMISRVRMHDLACPGRSRPGSRAFGPSTGPCASRPQSATDTSGIGDGLMPRPERAGQLPWGWWLPPREWSGGRS